VTWRLDGVDIAHPYQYRTPLDFTTIPALSLFGVKFTQDVGYVNPAAAATWRSMRDRGFRYRIAYHYLQPLTAGAAQADFFVDWLLAAGGPLQPGEAVMVDVERTSISLTQKVFPAFQIVQDFVARIRQRLGVACLLYLGRFHPYGTDPWIAVQPRWEPNYTTVPSLAETVIRQWGGGTEGAFVPGINGGLTRVDSNQIEQPAVLDRIANVAPPPKEIDMPLYLVKPNLDGPQPIELSWITGRRHLTTLAPAGREVDPVAALVSAGLIAVPPPFALTEDLPLAGGLTARIWRIEPALMDAVAGPYATGSDNTPVLGAINTLDAKVDTVALGVGKLPTTFPTHITINGTGSLA